MTANLIRDQLNATAAQAKSFFIDGARGDLDLIKNNKVVEGSARLLGRIVVAYIGYKALTGILSAVSLIATMVLVVVIAHDAAKIYDNHKKLDNGHERFKDIGTAVKAGLKARSKQDQLSLDENKMNEKAKESLYDVRAEKLAEGALIPEMKLIIKTGLKLRDWFNDQMKKDGNKVDNSHKVKVSANEQVSDQELQPGTVASKPVKIVLA